MRTEKIVEHFLSELTGIRNASNNTISSYQRDLRQFTEFCTDRNIIEIGDITQKHIRAYLVKLNGDKNSTGTISRKLTSLRNLFNFSLRSGYLNKNPLKDISNPKIKRGIPETLPLDSYLKILKLLEEEGKENKFQIKSIFELLYGSAIRVSELCGLDIGDIDYQSKTIKVYGKGSKERLVPLGDKSIKVLKEYMSTLIDKSFNDPLFLSPRGERIYPRLIQRIVKKYIQKVSDVSKKSPHILRHSAATHMLDRGADLLGVKEILGHENLKTTQIYTHVSVERLKKTHKSSHPKS